MLIGAVHGYRGLVRELLLELRKALGVRRLPVVATGGYAALIAARLPRNHRRHPVADPRRPPSRLVSPAPTFAMPKINLVIPHTLGVEEAKRRISRLVAETRDEFGHMISDLEESWNGNVETFRFRAMAFAVHGTIEAQPAAVLIELHYPFAAIPFKGRVESELLKHARALLA